MIITKGDTGRVRRSCARELREKDAQIRKKKVCAEVNSQHLANMRQYSAPISIKEYVRMIVSSYMGGKKHRDTAYRDLIAVCVRMGANFMRDKVERLDARYGRAKMLEILYRDYAA